MPYLGNQPAANFASVTKDTFDGGDTSGASRVSVYTLSKPATTNGVAVYVENVRQIPTTAYSVSGTTLTFTGTTHSGTNNVYVLHHNAVASTANHPASQDLTAVAGNFTGGVNLTGTTPTLTIGDAGAEDAKIVFDGNAQDYHIGLDDSADSLIIGKGSALGTTSHIVTDANGHVTKPLNSAFYCTGGAQSNFGIDSNQYFLEGDGSEVYDVNGDLSLSNNVSFSPGDVRYFTAPVTAKYMFTFRTRLDSVLTSPAYIYIFLKTSNRSYTFDMFDPDFMDSTPNYYSVQGTVIADMDTGDTAYPIIYISGGSNTIDSASTEFSGILIG